MGRGSVHHIAFRAKDDAEQAEMARKLSETHDLHVTQQLDRQYFRSVYFREPGGIIFEIATDQPGFAVDEPVATLGQKPEAAGLPGAAPQPDRSRAAIVGKGRLMQQPLSFTHRYEPSARAGRADPPPAAWNRRQRGRPAAARPHDRARRGAAVSARQGAGERHAALLPPSRGRRVRRGRRAAARRRTGRLHRGGARAPRPAARRSRSATRTAPTSPRQCCCCDRRHWPVPCCCAP